MRLKHFDHDGRARFITFCTHRRIPLLTNNRFRKIIVHSLEDMRSESGVKVLAYVIMPEHLHLVVVPPNDVKLGEVIGNMKRQSATAILDLLDNKALLSALTIQRNGQRRVAFWQRRCFDHNCRNEKVVMSKIHYCHINPVRRGMVAQQGDYPWSSYRSYYGLSDIVLEIDISGVAI